MDSRAARAGVLGLALAASACIPSARAEETWALDRAALSFGSYNSDLTLAARVNGTVSGTGPRFDGTSIDFHKEFNFGGSQDVLFAEASWRPFDRHEFRFDYHRDTREGSRELARDIVFDGETFPVRASVDARFQYRVIDARYTYWPLLTQRDAFGLSLGVATYHVELGLSGRASIDAGETTRSAAASADSDLPAPLIGLGYRHAFSERLRLFADASAFKASINAIHGTVGSLNAGLEYYPWRHFGLAVLYTGAELDGDVGKRGFEGHLKLRSSGYQVQVRMRR
jgi:hypothetical protein